MYVTYLTVSRFIILHRAEDTLVIASVIFPESSNLHMAGSCVIACERLEGAADQQTCTEQAHVSMSDGLSFEST